MARKEGCNLERREEGKAAPNPSATNAPMNPYPALLGSTARSSVLNGAALRIHAATGLGPIA